MAFAVQVNVKLIDAISAKLGKIQRSFGKLGAAVDTNRAKLDKFGKSLRTIGTRLSIGVTLPIAAVGVASIKMASDLQESITAVEVVFGEGAEIVKKFGRESAAGFGLSTAAFNQLSAETGALIADVGLPLEEVGQLTNELAVRAADLASVFNTDVAQAMSAIQQAIRGETEAIRKFTGDVTDASLETFALAEGIDQSVASMTQQEKRLLRVQLLMSQTSRFAGDFKKNQELLANQTRILSATFTNLAAKFGDVLLPVATKVVKAFNFLVKVLDESSPATKKIAVALALLVAAIPPLILALGAAIFVLGLFSTANIAAAASALAAIPPFIAMGVAAVGAMLPFLPIILVVGTAIAVLAGLIFKFWEPIKAFFAGIWEGFIIGFAPVLEVFSTLGDIAGAIFGLIGDAFGGLFTQTEGATDGFKTFGKVVGFILGGIANLISIPLALLGTMIKAIKFVASFVPGFGPGTTVEDAEEAAKATIEGGPAQANQLLAPAANQPIQNKIGIAVNIDKDGNATVDVSDEGQSTTTIDSIAVGLVTPVII